MLHPPMPYRSRRVFVRLLLPLTLVACAATNPSTRGQGAATARAPAPGPIVCVGAMAEPPEGARAVHDPALLESALGADGQGKLCAGAVFEATRPVTVYRVWQRDRAYTELGRWWSLDRPEGSREAYRQRNAICAEWSALDVWSRCELRAGARFVMGPGQSARCEGGAVLPRSETNQVYIDNDARQGRVYVDRCAQLGAWPEATVDAGQPFHALLGQHGTLGAMDLRTDSPRWSFTLHSRPGVT